MKKLFLALVASCAFVAITAQAGTCLKQGYTNQDITALTQAYHQQVTQLQADRDYAITHTTGESADEKNAQVLAIIQKYELDFHMAYESYIAAYSAMTYTCN